MYDYGKPAGPQIFAKLHLELETSDSHNFFNLRPPLSSSHALKASGSNFTKYQILQIDQIITKCNERMIKGEFWLKTTGFKKIKKVFAI